MATNTALPIRMKRYDILAMLAEARVWAEAVDAENLRVHQVNEKEYLARWKEACQTAAKWDYDTLKEARFSLGMGGHYDGPTCPRSQVTAIDRMIGFISKTTQPQFTLSRNGQWDDLWRIATADVPEVAGLC